ncbi:unnamed protein product [Urochloa humidicola]
MPATCGSPAGRGAIRCAVNSSLRAHPRPFPFVSLSCGFMKAVDADRAMLARRWFRLLAIKGVDNSSSSTSVATRRAAPTRRALQLRLPPSPVPRRVEVRRHLHIPARCVLSQAAGALLGAVALEGEDFDFLLAASHLYNSDERSAAVKWGPCDTVYSAISLCPKR